MNDYSKLKRLAEAATPGPWGYDGSYVCPARVEGGTTYVESWRSVADCSLTENTKFIAAANPAAVLALIAENERLDRESHNTRIILVDMVESRDQLKAENERFRSLLGECRVMTFVVNSGHSGVLRGQIDAAMSQGERS